LEGLNVGVTIYTDGACLDNPGRGGYAAILEDGKIQKVISGGYKLTTNNRMEIMAAIAGLEALKDICKVTVWSDSKYLVDAMNKGWARNWKQSNWKRSNNRRAANVDLWDRLLRLFETHDVDFKWVKGHSKNKNNERCDEVANNFANDKQLPEDEGYQNKVTTGRLL